MDTEDLSICMRLPTELLLAIFSHLTTHQPSLHASTLTCRRWNHLVTPLLWKTPTFHHLSQVECFTTTLVRTSGCSGRYARLVETLSFSTLSDGERNNPHLATLLDSIINCMVEVGSEEKGREEGRERWMVPTVIKRSRSLSRNDQGRFVGGAAAAVEEGDGDGDAAVATDDSALLTVPAPHTVCSPVTIPSTITATTPSTRLFCSDPPLPQYTSSLKHLDLRFCKGLRNYSLQRLAPKLSSLLVLNLAGGLRSDITIAKLAQHMVNLRRISLGWTLNLTDFGVSELVQRCKGIEALDLTYCTQIEDTSMMAIAHNLRGLRALSVAYCAGVTDIGVREVVAKCALLSVLDVDKCLRVSDRVRKSMEMAGIASAGDLFEPFSIHCCATLATSNTVVPNKKRIV
ncbi:hypothetical protein GGI15_003765 [Coemansia interrupta]|uniref:F-box domain-containing protein n=1 Tax=Coemansia interrupta TaxID=1126814 RepID=A0A9W8HDH5_9FUNG|nr:hypothetical protein GGI15_003765 [Coemansia interrupta]